jgi:prefoldin subunit 5
VPDDERTRRRLSDATKGRIADLASGWSVEPDAAPASPPAVAPQASAAPAPEAPSPRKKQKTLPPPPPGSEARKALENAILDAKPSATPEPVAPAKTAPSQPPPPPRSAKPTQPPPIPPARPKPPTAPPGAAQASQGAQGSGAIRPPDKGTGPRAAMPPLPATAPPVAPYASGDDKRAVPVGEFEDGDTLLEKDKLRIAHSQATIKRDVANSLLGVAEAPLTVVKPTPVEVLLTESAEHGRGDPTNIDPSTARFERGDPTNIGRPDITLGTTTPSRVHTAAGRLRTVAQLRRQRGLFGDVRYISTAVFGVRRARRELVDLETKQATRQASRRRYLVTLGRTAITSEGFDHPALGPAREQLAGVEDERARHTGQVVAADQELQRVKHDREVAAKQYVVDLAAVDAELTELQKRLEPLQKEHTAVSKRGVELREALRRAENKITEATAALVSVKGPKQDPAAIQAELAMLKADRVAVQRDEPMIAAQLDGLNPRIAALESKRTESQKRRADLLKTEEDDQRRAEELLAAIGAKRKVMDRAAGDAETLRDKILFELGERLYVDRLDELSPQMSPVDSIDVELGEADRRVMELREILSSIDRAKLARGIAVIVLTLAVVGSFTWWVLSTLS